MSTRTRKTLMSASLVTLAVCAGMLAAPAWSQDAGGSVTPPGEDSPDQRARERDERHVRMAKIQAAIAQIDVLKEQAVLELARHGIDPANIPAGLAAATVLLDDAKSDRIIIGARQEAVERAIEDLSVRLEVRTVEDEVVRALHVALEEARTLLAKLPEMIVNWEWDPEYHAQKAKVLDLQIALSDRRSVVAELHGAPTLRHLQAQSIDLEIDRFELRARIETLEARRAVLDDRLGEYESTLSHLDDERDQLVVEVQRLSRQSAGPARRR